MKTNDEENFNHENHGVLLETIKKRIHEVFSDPKNARKFQMFPYFEEIVTFLAVDYTRLDVPEILSNTSIKPFNKSANLSGVSKEKVGFSTIAEGFSFMVMDDKLNKPHKERVIRINQNMPDRRRFDFEDFSRVLAAKYGVPYGENFDRVRKEEVSSQDEAAEKILFGNCWIVMEEDYVNIMHNRYAPRVRLKKGYGEMFNNLEREDLGIKKKSLYNEEVVIRKTKETLTHEFLHSIASRKGEYWGGVVVSHFCLHEGMTEYLTTKTIERHKEFYSLKDNQKAQPFGPYKPFVAYAKMMDTIFPGCVEDVYFNGKEAVKKYKVGAYSLASLLDGFGAIQDFDYIKKDYPEEVKTLAAQEMIKSLMRQKDEVQKLLDKKQITQKQYDSFMSSMQVCYNGSLKNAKFAMDYDFKTQDPKMSKYEIKRDRKKLCAFMQHTGMLQEMYGMKHDEEAERKH